jgi:hypothetical protein
VLLAVSLGLKAVLALSSPAGSAAPPPRSEQLRRFLVAYAGPVEPLQGGWRLARGDCEILAFASARRGTLDTGAWQGARSSDRRAYVYRGRMTKTPPTWPLALDIAAYVVARPFRAGNEPGYVVLVARRACAGFPDLPWSRLPIA